MMLQTLRKQSTRDGIRVRHIVSAMCLGISLYIMTVLVMIAFN